MSNAARKLPKIIHSSKGDDVVAGWRGRPEPKWLPRIARFVVLLSFVSFLVVLAFFMGVQAEAQRARMAQKRDQGFSELRRICPEEARQFSNACLRQVSPIDQ